MREGIIDEAFYFLDNPVLNLLKSVIRHILRGCLQFDK